MHVRQQGNVVYVEKQRGGTEKWSVNGSVAQCAGFVNGVPSFPRSTGLTIQRMYLLGPTSLRLTAGISVIPTDFGPIQDAPNHETLYTKIDDR